MGYLYIVSFTNLINDSCFKIGVTSNPSVNRLLSRYRTYGDCIIIAFVSLGNLDMFHYETLIKRSVQEGRMIHGDTMVSEWIRIRYESLVLVIKAVLMLNSIIKIHSDHFIIEEPEDLVDKRFLEIPLKFRCKIMEPISFGDFDPSINDVYQLLVPPSKLHKINIDQMFPGRDPVSMRVYFMVNTIDVDDSTSVNKIQTENNKQLPIENAPNTQYNNTSQLLTECPGSSVPRTRKTPDAPRLTKIPDAPHMTTIPDSPYMTKIPDAPRMARIPDSPQFTKIPDSPQFTKIPDSPHMKKIPGHDSQVVLDRLEYNYQSMRNAAGHLLGLCSKLSGNRVAILDVDKCEPEVRHFCENNSLIVSVPEIAKKIRFDPPKSNQFMNKMDKLYSLLVSFINEKCVIGPNHKIMASTFLSVFSKEIGEDINNKIEFPALMLRYSENNPNLQINKRSTCKGVIYSGIEIQT